MHTSDQAIQSHRNRISGADRQAIYKARMRKAGYQQRTIWFHKFSENIGYEQGVAGNWNPLPKPDGVEDELSYLSGWSRGLDDFAIMEAAKKVAEMIEKDSQ